MSSPADITTKEVVSVLTDSGHVLSSYCVRWSANNWIAVVTDRQLTVLTTRSDPKVSPQLEYLKTVVANPDQPMIFECGFTTKQVLDVCDNDQQQILMCDPSLAGETPNSAHRKAFRQVEWSPVCSRWGCFLAGLTLDHRLVVYAKDADNWRPTIDLSVLLNDTLRQQWSDDKIVRYETYASRMYSLATFCFCWTQDWRQIGDSTVCQLLMASKNGLITFWDVTVGAGKEISADMAFKWETSFGQIDCIKSYDNFAIISSIKGTVSVIRTDFDTDSDSLPDSLATPLLLWSEEDCIRVNDVAIKSMDNSVYEIVFTKSVFVIICRFSAEPFQLKTCQTVPGVHQMPSTSVCPILDAKYLLTSLDGRLIELDISDDLTVSQSEVTLEGLNSVAMCPHGCDSSFNGVLSVMVQSVSQLYDHLVIKESVRIVVFANVSLQDLSDIICQNFLADGQTSAERKISFDEYFDYLDCVRSLLPNDLDSSLIPYLWSLTENQSPITNCRHIHKLRIIRFVGRIYGQVTKDETVRQALESMVSHCEQVIRKLYFEEVLYQLVSQPLNSITKSQLLSIKNTNSWHMNHFSTPLIQNAQSLNLSSVAELCPICSVPIAFESHLYGQCSNNHRFDRCSNSLVLLDFVRHKYQRCYRCVRSLVTRPPVWPFREGSSFCLFCQ